MDQSIYSLSAYDTNGNLVQLSQFKGKVLLIVNTASMCGFTKQYAGLQLLYEKYKSRGFEVLAFPCNQFNHQEPGENHEISEFCKSNYGATFPIFSKIDVKGRSAHPLFVLLTHQAPGIFGSKEIKWNFTKFLVDRTGNPIKRYAPMTIPENIKCDIEKIL